MHSDKRYSAIALIAGELAFGIALSLVFFSVVLTGDGFGGNSYVSGIVWFFALLNIVFFIAVFSVGIFGAVTLGQSHKIKKAIVYAIVSWFLSLLVYILMERFFLYIPGPPVIRVYIVLVGIIAGFNIGLKSKAKPGNAAG